MPSPPLTIGFDADDTLWHNQPIFERAYESFRELLAGYHDPQRSASVLLETEIRNHKLYGYGIKGYTLSAIETAITLSDGKISAHELRGILDAAREMLEHPVELLEGVTDTLAKLSADHRLILITKGDLLDQHRKLEKSGLVHHFDHIEIVSEKDPGSYRKILTSLAIDPADFLMVGNSVKSDILPVLALGAAAAHIPYHVTWEAEQADDPTENLDRFFKLESMSQLPEIIRQITF